MLHSMQRKGSSQYLETCLMLLYFSVIDLHIRELYIHQKESGQAIHSTVSTAVECSLMGLKYYLQTDNQN